MLVEYLENGDLATFNGAYFRRDKKTGYYLSTKKIKRGKRVRLHIYVWETINGPLPTGWHVHHIDFDKSNNEPENLAAMPEFDHLSLHAQMKDKDTQREVMRAAATKAPRWHRSQEGRAWHKEHGRESWKEREAVEYECTWCGKKYQTRHRYKEGTNHFCSNNCRSAFRRASHVDDEDRRCAVCGSIFRVNKYSKMDRCQACRRQENKASGKSGRIQP